MGKKIKNLRNWHNFHKHQAPHKFNHIAAEYINTKETRCLTTVWSTIAVFNKSHPSDYILKIRYGFNTSTTIDN